MITKEVVNRAISENFVVIEDDEEDEVDDVGLRGIVSSSDKDMFLHAFIENVVTHSFFFSFI